jgi:hypothetical protein
MWHVWNAEKYEQGLVVVVVGGRDLRETDHLEALGLGKGMILKRNFIEWVGGGKCGLD